MTTNTATRGKNLYITAVLTFIFPGLGYYYAGVRFVSALQIAALLAAANVFILNAPPHLFNWKISIVVTVLTALTFKVGICWHAVTVAKQNTEVSSPKHFLKFIITALVVSIVISLIEYMPGVKNAKNFSVPTVAMEPTIKAGDRVRARLIAYTKDFLPKRGDLVVFKYPKDPTISYIKRVIGLPGDRILIRNDVIILNGEPQPLNAHNGDRIILSDISDQAELKLLFKEALEGSEHWVMHNQPYARHFTRPNWPENGGVYLVPADSIMVMGDNRDNSTDSRHFGPVPIDYLIGHVEGVVFSLKSSNLRWYRTGMDLN